MSTRTNTGTIDDHTLINIYTLHTFNRQQNMNVYIFKCRLYTHNINEYTTVRRLKKKNLIWHFFLMRQHYFINLLRRRSGTRSSVDLMKCDVVVIYATTRDTHVACRKSQENKKQTPYFVSRSIH